MVCVCANSVRGDFVVIMSSRVAAVHSFIHSVVGRARPQSASVGRSVGARGVRERSFSARSVDAFFRYNAYIRFIHSFIMKVARTKAQLKHLKTKRKKAKDKRQRRQARERTTGMMMAMRVDDATEGPEAPMVETLDVDEETRGTAAAAPSGRARQSDVARRKRELRDRIAELKSKRSKIGKKNFGKSEERKRLTMMIKELEKERAAVCAGGGGGGAGAEDAEEGDEDDAMVDAHE